jgi:hypothetical protein
MHPGIVMHQRLSRQNRYSWPRPETCKPSPKGVIQLFRLAGSFAAKPTVQTYVSFRAIKNGYPAAKLLKPPLSVRILNERILSAAIADA